MPKLPSPDHRFIVALCASHSSYLVLAELQFEPEQIFMGEGGRTEAMGTNRGQRFLPETVAGCLPLLREPCKLI